MDTELSPTMSRLSPRSQLEQEKRIRREIANSNERRRMQSINAGFNSLRTMLPKHDGEKLSKAAILQHTAEYIYQLEQDKTRLLQEISKLKKLCSNTTGADDDGAPHLPPLKRLKIESMAHVESPNSDSSDEGIQCHAGSRVTALSGTESEAGIDDFKNELIEVRKILDRERRLRMQLEDQVRSLESQLYPERIKEIAQQVQLQFSTNPEDSHLSATEETAVAVSSVVNDEIVAETIEIEAHSCPGSPLQPTSFIIQAPISNPSSSPSSPLHEIPQDLSTKQALGLSSIPMTSNSKINSKSSQPAAIALPIDMPFVGNESTSNSGATTITLRIMGSIGDSTKTEANSSANPTTSRQNLDTIVEAIRHLEGDHLFRDDIKLVTAVSHAI
ncbi:transcription factor cropped [Brevipalpus obovatus]|uniref:transcription factor cropped n=1 Tax=Brevipalpus obovatus TaxID=246614 RepID=UPI003D9EF4BF